jgi:hypothetical protein
MAVVVVGLAVVRVEEPSGMEEVPNDEHRGLPFASRKQVSPRAEKSGLALALDEQ